MPSLVRCKDEVGLLPWQDRIYCDRNAEDCRTVDVRRDLLFDMIWMNGEDDCRPFRAVLQSCGKGHRASAGGSAEVIPEKRSESGTSPSAVLMRALSTFIY